MPPTRSHNWENFEQRAKGFEVRCSTCHKGARFPADLDWLAQGQCPGHMPDSTCDHMLPSKLTSAVISIPPNAEKCLRCDRTWFCNSTYPDSLQNKWELLDPQSAASQRRTMRIPVYTETGPAYSDRQLELNDITPAKALVMASLDYINRYYKVNYTQAEWDIIDPQGYLRIAAANDVSPIRDATSNKVIMLTKRLCRSVRVRWKKRFTPKPTARQLYPKIPIIKETTGRRMKQLIKQQK